MHLFCAQQMISATIQHNQHHIDVCQDRRRRHRYRSRHRQHFDGTNLCVHHSKCSVHAGNRHQCRPAAAAVAIKMTKAQRRRRQQWKLTIFPNDLAKNSIGTLRNPWPMRRQRETHNRQQQRHSQLKTKRIFSMRSPPKKMSTQRRRARFHPTYPWTLHRKRPLCYKYPCGRRRISIWWKNRCVWTRMFAIW